VPSGEYSVKTVHYTPYIFTDYELRKLFEAFDTLRPHFEAPEREYIVPVLFRMMYFCGMRPAEPLKLLYEDEIYKQVKSTSGSQREKETDEFLCLKI